jgi:1-pyrroline-4-hydroxy-2-carboxylate deaminase
MDRNSVDWRGYWPASPTPFKASGEIDWDAFDSLLDWYLEQKMHGIFINGTTGEWFSQSHEERKAVAEFVAKKIAKRIPVVIGVTTFTAKESIELGKHAISVGLDGVCSSAPAYVKTLPDETVAYFESLSRGINGPIMIYNWPHGSGIEIAADLAHRLADIDNIVAIKDSTPNGEQFLNTTKELSGKVRIFGNFMVPSNLDFMLRHGGDGTIGGGSIFGRADTIYWEQVWAGDIESARKHAERNLALLEALWLPGGWAGKWGGYQSQLKAIMEMIGVPGGTVRAPRLPITDPASLTAIRTILSDFGLIKA